MAMIDINGVIREMTPEEEATYMGEAREIPESEKEDNN